MQTIINQITPKMINCEFLHRHQHLQSPFQGSMKRISRNRVRHISFMLQWDFPRLGLIDINWNRDHQTRWYWRRSLKYFALSQAKMMPSVCWADLLSSSGTNRNIFHLRSQFKFEFDGIFALLAIRSHDSAAVVSCTKFWSDHYIIIEIKEKRNFYRIWIPMGETLANWSPGFL